MTSHSGDELDTLIRWTLGEQVRYSQPPPEVWRKIELKLTSRAVGGVGIWSRLTRRLRSSPGEDLLRPATCRPLMFYNWVNYMQPSLAYMVEQYLAILRVGWAT